jgi:hypothetical protein
LRKLRDSSLSIAIERGIPIMRIRPSIKLRFPRHHEQQ